MTAPGHERLRRRLALGTGRLRHSLPGAGPRHRAVIFHMPKCGGTSLTEAAAATIPLQRRLGAIDAIATRRAAALLHHGRDDPRLCHEDLDGAGRVFALREALMLQHMAWDSPLIHGHLMWSEIAARRFGGRYGFVTLLREPVARTVSNIRMAQRRGLAPADMARALETPMARRQARAYLRHLAGQNDIAEPDLPAAVALARSRLDRFALIGLLEDRPGFVRRYRARFGVTLRLARRNAAPAPPPEYPAPLMARLRGLCAPDIEIYDHARRRLGAAGC